MSVIKWRDAYNTGIAQFDKEHHKLVELIDTMYSAIRNGNDKEMTEKACTELVAYTIYHFDNEELAMAEVNYPELAGHKAEHEQLKKEAQGFQTRISTGFPDGVSELYRFLRDWLINHIQESDKKYGLYMQNRKTSP